MSVCCSSISMAQSKSIQWTGGLSWNEILQKSELENKYIFIDAYATWCKPCKEMDNNIYRNDTIADFFNDRFISVKLQMDKTKADDAFVKSWYEIADSLKKNYRIDGYPTFIFLSPAGVKYNRRR